MVPWRLAAAILVVHLAEAAWYDTFTGNQITDQRVAELRVNRLIPFCAVEVQECDPYEHRRMDNSCNNLHYPPRGALLTPYHRMLPPEYAADGGPRVAKSGRPLPNVRSLRVAMVPDGRLPNKHLTHMVTNLNVFLIGDCTSVHDTVNYVVLTRTCCAPGGDSDPRCIPIKVADDDLHLRYSSVRCLNLTRAITYQRMGCVPPTVPGERINTSPPMVEMSNVYGSDIELARKVRSYKGGRLVSEPLNGRDWPKNGSSICVNNDRDRGETRCHDHGAASNALIGINIILIWYIRHHNYLADQLTALNPCWDDEQAYTTARNINIAQYQHTLYYELMAFTIGYDFLVKNKVIFPDHLHVDDYDEELEPRVSLEYVLSTRWFHTLQEGRINLYDPKGKKYGQLDAVALTLRTGLLALNNTLGGCTQGAFRQPCATSDYVVDPDIGERVLDRLQFASDVVSSDIMKTRDVGLPSYNKYRKLCKLPELKSFKDLYMWMPVDQANAITDAYVDVDDIDLMAGILGEKPMADSIMGPTLACVMADQLLRWRRADRFWYENSVHPGAFTQEQLADIKRVSSMAKIICDHGDTVTEVQPNVFLLPGPGNEMTDCHNYPSLDISLWKDPKCYQQDKNLGPRDELQTSYASGPIAPWWQ